MMFTKGLLRLVAILVLTVLILLPQSLMACFNPLDEYSYEVLLNKPGIEINENMLRELGYNVISYGQYVKQSTADPRLKVILSLVNLKEVGLGSGSALSIRFQLEENFLPLPEYLAVLRVKNTSLEQAWFSEKLNNVIYVFNKVNGNVQVTAIGIKYKGSLLDFEKDVKNHVAQKLTVPLENVEAVSISELKIPIVDLETIDWGNVVKIELELLVRNGAIKGLSYEDIYEISAIAKPGYAGWNSRIVYYKNSWIPYFKTDNPLLLKCVPPAPTFTVTLDTSALPPIPTPTPTPTPRTTTVTMTTTPTITPTATSLSTSSLEGGVEARKAYSEEEFLRTTTAPTATMAYIFIMGFVVSIIAWFIVRKVI